MGLFNKLSEDDRAVSPVIGVVLMVAVVVILAAVIGAFVLGLGGDQSSAPQASFSMDNGDVIYEGGDDLNGDNLEITVAGGKDKGTKSGELNAGQKITKSTLTTAGTVRVVYTGNGKSTTIWKTDYDGSGGTA